MPPRATGNRNRVGEGRNAQGVGQRERETAKRNTQGGREGERGKKTSYIHMREDGPGPLPPGEASALSPGGSHEHPLCQCQAPDHPAHVLGQEALRCRHEHTVPRRSSPRGSRQNPGLGPRWRGDSVRSSTTARVTSAQPLALLATFLLQDALLWAPCGARGTE